MHQSFVTLLRKLYIHHISYIRWVKTCGVTITVIEIACVLFYSIVLFCNRVRFCILAELI